MKGDSEMNYLAHYISKEFIENKDIEYYGLRNEIRILKYSTKRHQHEGKKT